MSSPTVRFTCEESGRSPPGLEKFLQNFADHPPLVQSACRLEAKVRKLKPSPWKIGLSFGTAVAIHGRRGPDPGCRERCQPWPRRWKMALQEMAPIALRP